MLVVFMLERMQKHEQEFTLIHTDICLKKTFFKPVKKCSKLLG